MKRLPKWGIRAAIAAFLIEAAWLILGREHRWIKPKAGWYL